MKPLLLQPGEFNTGDLNQLRQANKLWQTVDIYEQQLHELFEMLHPDGKGNFADFGEQQGQGELAGAWAYYPWSGVLLHCVGPDELFKLRTNRNRNVITEVEQATLAASAVAVAGMSVGAGIALACVYSGMANTIKIADFDTLETANLNRLRESLPNVGKPKVDLAAQKIYELNPFADVRQFDGVNKANINDFFGSPEASVVVDEIDDFKMKVHLRLQAKAHKMPLLMLTSLGDNILIDIERYDTDPDLALFNGAIADVPDEILAKQDMSPDDMKRYAVQLVGQEYVPTKALASLPEIGHSLVGRPQLHSTVTVDGGLAAYIIRCIILGEPVRSGRYFVKFAELVGMAASDVQDSPERRQILQKLLGK